MKEESSDHRPHQEPRRPLIILGQHCAGKSWLAESIAAETVAQTIELGDVVRAEASKRANNCLVRVAADLLAKNPLHIVQLAVEGIPETWKRVVIVGPRTFSELAFLRSIFPDALVIGLNTPRDVRFERWQNRTSSYSDTWEERELLEARWGTSELLQQCDVTIRATDEVLNRCVALVRTFGVEVLAYAS